MSYTGQTVKLSRKEYYKNAPDYWTESELVDFEEVVSEFDEMLSAEAVPIFAQYETPPYEGYAWVIFVEDGKFYEVHGSHCSCNGLEGQFDPEETTAEAIIHRLNRAIETDESNYYGMNRIGALVSVESYVEWLERGRKAAAHQALVDTLQEVIKTKMVDDLIATMADHPKAELFILTDAGTIYE